MSDDEEKYDVTKLGMTMVITLGSVIAFAIGCVALTEIFG